jgi:hypothetical protein
VFMCRDSPRYLLYVQCNGIPRSTSIARLSFELNCFKYLLSQDLSCYQVSQSPLTLLCPSYVQMNGCPFDLDEQPDYYNI